jgi:hypothetical protein
MTSAAEAGFKAKLLPQLKRCATQNQMQWRVFSATFEVVPFPETD